MAQRYPCSMNKVTINYTHLQPHICPLPVFPLYRTSNQVNCGNPDDWV